jgi:spore coat protein A, manganese oxidase
MWYHDHAMDITRLNAYAGLASAYVLIDANELNLINTGILPAAAQTIYMVLQDKSFKADGSLWYPFQYEHATAGTSNRWNYGPDSLPQPVPPAANPDGLPVSLVPEAFLDTTIINGCCYPYLQVQRRHYRFRILNGSQARFYNLQLYYADPSFPTEIKMVPANGATYAGPYGNVTVPNDLRFGGVPDPRRAGPMITQIGTEGGFLPAPVALNNPPRPIDFDANPASPTFGNATAYNLLLAPGERCDLLIDFTDVPTGSNLILYSDSPGPFPGGDPRNDYFTNGPDYSILSGNPDGLTGGAPSPRSGYGPNTRTLMQFRVAALAGTADPARLDTLPQLASKQQASIFLPAIEPLPRAGAKVRRLTLNETFETAATSGSPFYGRLIQILGTTVVRGVDEWGTPMFYQSYLDSRGDVVKRGNTEIWELYNLTADTHPIHFHLVNVQVLNRQVFNDAGYMAAGTAAASGTNVDPTPFLIGNPVAPDNNELGWKETIRMDPHTVTRVIMRFDLPSLPWPIPRSTRLVSPMDPPGPNNPRINGYEYVWHCHILEHEEHDMMRALVVEPPNITGAISGLLL